MVKVSVNKDAKAPTASEQLMASATAEAQVTDARGRVIKLRKPGVLAQFRIVETLGATSSNETYMRMVLPLLYVGAIDGDDDISMTKKSEVEALIQRLDEDGLAAVVVGVAKHYGQQDPEADKAKLGN